MVFEDAAEKIVVVVMSADANLLAAHHTPMASIAVTVAAYALACRHSPGRH